MVCFLRDCDMASFYEVSHKRSPQQRANEQVSVGATWYDVILSMLGTLLYRSFSLFCVCSPAVAARSGQDKKKRNGVTGATLRGFLRLSVWDFRHGTHLCSFGRRVLTRHGSFDSSRFRPAVEYTA